MITLQRLHKSCTTGRNSLHVLRGIDLKIEGLSEEDKIKDPTRREKTEQS